MFCWSKDQLREMLLTESYLEFLTKAFRERELAESPLSFAEVARRAGFSARSYPRDVLNGTRGLTLESAKGFSRALALPAFVARYFFFLVEKERLKNDPFLSIRAKKLRAGALRKLSDRSVEPKSSFRHPEFSRVFAALGDPSVGATIDEIAKRAKLKRESIQEVLDELKQVDLVVLTDEGRWKCCDRVMLFEKLSQDGFFPRHFSRRVSEVKKLAEEQFDREDALFWEATCSIKSRDLPALKAKLRELVSEILDAYESPEGDVIVSSVVSIFPLGS